MVEAHGIDARLCQAARWCGGDLQGTDGRFRGVSSDTRSLVPGNLFVALTGPRHDGHDHVASALAKGAAGALVSHTVEAPAQVVVDDTRLALGRLASAWRRQRGTPLVAVTGSNGKTTVKEMLAAILGQAGPTLSTRGNLNNDIGVPLTLLGLDPIHRFAVVEMGANHPGEIAYLTHLAQPDVALITNAAAAHLAGFGSLDGVARAKGEIYEGLAENGTAVVNADDLRAAVWRARTAGRRLITFGLEAAADVRADFVPEGEGYRLTVTAPDTRFETRLALLGRHNVLNALAATAAAVALGIDGERIARGLAAVHPVRGRLQGRPGEGGARLIDDSYNANPASLEAGLAVLAAFPGRRLLVLGDMGELGESESDLHAAAGRRAREAGIDGLYATGALSREAAAAFGAEGRHFADREALVAALRADLSPGVTVLIKGSRAAGMDAVADALAERGGC